MYCRIKGPSVLKRCTELMLVKYFGEKILIILTLIPLLVMSF